MRAAFITLLAAEQGAAAPFPSPAARPSGNELLPAFAANAPAPPAPNGEARDKRRHEDRRRRRAPEQREDRESPEEPAGYRIEDIVQFAGETIAQRHADFGDSLFRRKRA